MEHIELIFRLESGLKRTIYVPIELDLELEISLKKLTFEQFFEDNSFSRTNSVGTYRAHL